jgi:hypothetical protein
MNIVIAQSHYLALERATRRMFSLKFAFLQKYKSGDFSFVIFSQCIIETCNHTIK